VREGERERERKREREKEGERDRGKDLVMDFLDMSCCCIAVDS